MAGCHNKRLKRAVSWVVCEVSKFVRYLIHRLFIVGLVLILIGLVCSGLVDGYTGLGTWFAALGTWLLAWIGYFGVVTAIKAKQREILSGLKIGRVNPSGVAWIKNTSKEWIQFSAWVNEMDHINHENGCNKEWGFGGIENFEEEDIKKLFGKTEASKSLYSKFKIAPGAKVPIHLKNITIEETYVAFSAVKIVIEKESYDWLWGGVKDDEERTRIVVYRYVGGRIQNNPCLKHMMHPHKKWVPLDSW